MAPPSTTADHDRLQARRKLAVFALLLLCFLLYAPSLGSDFVWDDRDAATAGGSGRNPLVAELRPLGDYLRGNWWPQRNPYAETYRPLTTYSFAVRHALCGDHALVAHLWSVLLHTLGVGLVFQLLRNLGAAFAPAWLGAAVFGLHALHGEAVLTIVGQAELLALVFGLLGTAASLHAAAADGGAWRWWLAAALAFTAACFSKESAVAWSVVTPACVAIAQQVHHRTNGTPHLAGTGPGAGRAGAAVPHAARTHARRAAAESVRPCLARQPARPPRRLATARQRGADLGSWPVAVAAAVAARDRLRPWPTAIGDPTRRSLAARCRCRGAGDARHAVARGATAAPAR